MTAWAYCLAYNESLLIKYWVRHYKTFCERVIVYVDKESDDDTSSIAKSEGAEVRDYYGQGNLDDITFIRFAQDHYREARGLVDWVIWVDADEILYHPNLSERLVKMHSVGINAPNTIGFGMISDKPPEKNGQIYQEIQHGIPAVDYSKVAIFSPFLDVEWAPGKHTAKITGPIDVIHDDGTDPLRLLHYRWMGEQWFLDRNKRNFERISSDNRRSMYGKETYPEYEGIYSKEWYKNQMKLAKICVDEKKPHRLFGRWL